MTNQATNIDYSKRARESFIWMASSTAIWQIISWVMTLATARFLMPSDYGLVAMNDIMYPYLMMVTVLGLDSWMVQRSDFSKNDEKSIFTLLVLFGVISTIIAFFGASFIAWFYNEPKAEAAFKVGSLVYLFRGFQVVPEVRLKRELKFKPLALMNLSVGILRGLFQVAFAYLGYGYWSLVLGAVLKEFLSLIWLIVVAGLPSGFKFNGSLIKEAVKFGISAAGATIFWVIFSSADNVVVGKLFGTQVLGYYAMAFYLADLPMSKINGVIQPVLMPFFSRIKEDKERLKITFIKVNAMVVSVVTPILFGFAVVAPVMVPLVIGEKWLQSVLPLQVLCVVGLLRTLTNCSSPLMYALGKPKLSLLWAAVNAIIMPIAFIVCGRAWGLNGIYGAWLIIFPISGVYFMIVLLKQVINIGFLNFTFNLSGAIVSGVVMILACLSVEFLYYHFSVVEVLNASSMHRVSLLLLQIFVGALVYLSVYYLCFRKQARLCLDMLTTLKNRG